MSYVVDKKIMYSFYIHEILINPENYKAYDI